MRSNAPIRSGNRGLVCKHVQTPYVGFIIRKGGINSQKIRQFMVGCYLEEIKIMGMMHTECETFASSAPDLSEFWSTKATRMRTTN